MDSFIVALIDKSKNHEYIDEAHECYRRKRTKKYTKKIASYPKDEIVFKSQNRYAFIISHR